MSASDNATPAELRLSGGPAASGTADPNKEMSPEEIEREIGRTRRDLDQNIKQLAEKFDVKTQAKHQVEEAKSRATLRFAHAQDSGQRYARQVRDLLTDDESQLNTNGWALAGGLAVAVGIVTLLAIRSARR